MIPRFKFEPEYPQIKNNLEEHSDQYVASSQEDCLPLDPLPQHTTDFSKMKILDPLKTNVTLSNNVIFHVPDLPPPGKVIFNVINDTHL